MNIQELISFSFSSGRYTPSEYDTDLIGTSDCNAYIPFYTLFAHNLLSFEETDTRVLEYSLPSSNVGRFVRQYAHLFETLKNSYYSQKYLFKISGEDREVFLHRGLIYSGETIYLCLGIRSEYVLNTPIEEIRTNPDITQFTLFINTSFETEEHLRNINKNVDKLYISPMKELGIDIVHTSRINGWLFRNNFVTPTFKNVGEMMKHLKEDVPTLID